MSRIITRGGWESPALLRCNSFVDALEIHEVISSYSSSSSLSQKKVWKDDGLVFLSKINIFDGERHYGFKETPECTSHQNGQMDT